MAADSAGLPELDRAGATLGLLLRVHRVLFDAVDGELRKGAGLSFALWEALFVLALAPEERLRMVDIKKQMCVSKSNVTQLIDKLEEAGFVARETSSSDRRLTYAKLTKDGLQASRRGWSIFNALAARRFSAHMSSTEMKSVGSALAKVLGAHEPGGVDDRASA
jgi:DNA-binding MarR family transcriptional regulator